MSDCRCIQVLGTGSADKYGECPNACHEKKAVPKRTEVEAPLRPKRNLGLDTAKLTEALERCAKRFGVTACNR